MVSLKVYQIGLGSFGRYGFEKLLEMEKHLTTVDLNFVGVYDEDHERSEMARKFAESNGQSVEIFNSLDEMYSKASQDENSMIYDAAPSTEHAGHLKRSVRHDIFHLAEKPPSMTRDQHLEERKLDKAMWKADFVERESPVVKKATEIVEDEIIDSIKIFRESPVGISKMVAPVKRFGVQGGDILDKMTHEIYVKDLLNEEKDLELNSAESVFFVPYRSVSDSLMTIKGNKTSNINQETANGMSKAFLSAGEVDIEFHSSWVGPSREAVEAVADLDHNPFLSEVSREEDEAFRDIEARFFIIEGSRTLMGDMLNEKLIDLDSGEEIEIPDLIHDQLYRVIRKAVETASGYREVEQDGTLEFMDCIFDAREAAIENSENFHRELEKAKKRVDGLLINESFEDSEIEDITA